MTIADELIGLELSARVELFVIDSSEIGGDVLYFHNGTNALTQPVTWQDQVYTPMPIQVEGLDITAQSGAVPRPKLRVSNVFGLIGLLLAQYGDLEGARVVRKLTHARYLDAVNWPGGVNDQANPDVFYPDEEWFVDRVSRDDGTVIEWDLTSPLDLEGVVIPGRRCDAMVCGWIYRSADCGYTGGPVAKADDTPTSDSALDDCGLLISSCKLRFGKVLPSGAFPGAGIARAG